ncbi:MAG: hypothetical protein UY26_C0002G0128 [Candidatus Jorgensenbacteria bacterium GW2011_GWA1_48_13]|nr:MAG: hypothetical protein UY26_C0002G0128 [Candidatus Jorgensenbacteria bacterium GW2011_GWA1_48_13]
MRNQFEREIEQETDVELAFRRAEEALALDVIKEKDFIDLYGEDNVERDLAEIQKIEASPEYREPSKMATVLEAIIHEQAELSDWLGPDARTMKTSRYDDVKNGVDEIVEFTGEPGKTSRLALGIDVTFNPVLDKKLERIVSKIERGELAQVKYFKSSSLRGEVQQIPEVVVGADQRTVEQLIPVWLARDQGKLAQHPMQIIMLEEIRLQLEAFAAYARAVGQPAIAETYETDLAIANELLTQKEDLRKRNPLQALKNDQVFFGICLYLERLRKKLKKK